MSNDPAADFLEQAAKADPARYAELERKHPIASKEDHLRFKEGKPLKRVRREREASQEADGLGYGGSYVPPYMRRKFTDEEWAETSAAWSTWLNEHEVIMHYAQELADDGIARAQAYAEAVAANED